MGNDPSKRADKEVAPSPEASSSSCQADRVLPELQTRRVVPDLVSRALPVDRHWYESAPDTPTSDLSASDAELEREDTSKARSSQPLLSHDPHGSHALDSEDDVAIDEDAPSSQTLHQLMHRFVQGPQSIQLLVGTVDYPCMEKVTRLAQCIGFEMCAFDGPLLRLERSAELQAMSCDMRSVLGHQTLENRALELQKMGLRDLDVEMESGLATYLKQQCVGTGEAPPQGGVYVEVEVEGCLLSAVTVKKIFQTVATECRVLKQVPSATRIALIVDPEGAKAEKVIQKGELVWRRLQHWSTNVRKEKKFNIWAKGLPEYVKDRILKIALEIGFETAAIQQNGNIHLEIKPPEGQHRRKLKHATDELRKELEPIDEAVCQNVEQHLNEWLSEFQQSGKQKDILNCRFVLPAEWLRQTSERLASQYGLCVKMETGIELLFHYPDTDLSSSQEAAVAGKELPAAATGVKKSNKSKNSKAKKKSPESSVKSEPGMNGHVVTAAPMHERLMQAPHPPPPMMPFDARMNDPSSHNRALQPPPPPPPSATTAAAAPNAIQLSMPNNRRASSRNKYDYGWDPSWPTAHPERAATTQHTF